MSAILNKIIQLNQSIEQSSEQNNWDSVAELAADRHNLVQLFFDSNPSPSELSQMHILAEDIAQFDKKIKKNIQQQKKQSVSEGLNLKHAHNAVKQYRQDYDI